MYRRRPAAQPTAAAPTKASKKIALVTTAYHYLSHAYHVGGRFLDGYLRDGKMHYPDFAIAAMYVEQQKDNDLSKELSRKHGFTIYPDVAGALTLGGDKLAVDGVILIGEHGDYPYNDKLQKLYPRYELFQKIVAVFEKSKKSVPVFCDKHLYYDRKKAADDGRDGPQDRLSADGGVEPADHLAPAGIGIAARQRHQGSASSPRAARSRFTAFTLSNRCNVWSNAVSRAARRRSRASRP